MSVIAAQRRRRFKTFRSQRLESRGRVAIIRYGFFPHDPILVRDTRALIEQGFEVDLFCLREAGDPFIRWTNGVRIFRLPPARKGRGLADYLLGYVGFSIFVTVLTAILTPISRYAVVEIDNLPDWLVVAGLFPKLCGSKLIAFWREDFPRLFAADHELPLRHPVIRSLFAMQRLFSRPADAVIVTQELARRDLMDQGVDPAKIVAVINSSEEVALAYRSSAGLRAKTVDRFELLTHGTIVRRYGIETMLQAISLLRDTIPNIHLTVIGIGSFRTVLEEQAESLGIAELVTFTGWVSDTDLAGHIASANLGLIALWNDFQFCTKLMDYLALGIPAIATESSALRPYFSDAEVHFVPPRDPGALVRAIQTLHDDPERRASLAAAGHAAFVDRLSWQKVQTSYLSVFDRLTGYAE